MVNGKNGDLGLVDSLSSAYLVEVLVVGPDALVGWLSAPPPAPALGVMPHNVDDAARRVQGLVDAA